MSSQGRKLPKQLVEENLYNWLGYGNLDGRYWFIGREEYDSIKKCEYLDDLRDYYEVRRSFDYAEDFVDVWEDSYGRSVSAGTTSATTRHYQAAFLLAFDGVSPSGTNPTTGMSKTASFVFGERRFGRPDGNHFSGEVLPLRYHPDKPSTFDPYRHVWKTPAAYEAEVLPKRIDLYVDQLRAHPDVEVVISYTEYEEFVGPLVTRFDAEFVGRRPANKRNHFEVYRCQVAPDHSVMLVDAPFFGQGHVGYDQIQALANDLGAAG